MIYINIKKNFRGIFWSWIHIYFDWFFFIKNRKYLGPLKFNFIQVSVSDNNFLRSTQFILFNTSRIFWMETQKKMSYIYIYMLFHDTDTLICMNVQFMKRICMYQKCHEHNHAPEKQQFSMKRLKKKEKNCAYSHPYEQQNQCNTFKKTRKR